MTGWSLWAALLLAQATAEPTKPTPLGNVGQWFGRDDYPATAVRAGEQGRVIALIEVAVDGGPTKCDISVSSGSAALDETTCAIAMAKIRFKPARDARGRAVAGSYPLAVRWQMDDKWSSIDVDAMPVEFVEEREFVLDPQGTALSCRVILPPSALGECPGFTVGGKMSRPRVRAGKPIGGTLTVRVISRFKPDADEGGDTLTRNPAPPK